MKKILKRYDKPGKWEVVIPFNKTGEEREFLGIIDARQAGEYELRVSADHKAPMTKGRITVRAVAGKGAVLKIRGIIRISKEAQETDDFLELRVLTLDQSARAIADPELEIEANNVKASHAASVGPVDSEQILYLMSRGLARELAQEEIVGGWLGSII
ncbi:MAG: SufD family Fe-S cluster assembly protein [Microgenomates group bacterium]